MPGDMTRWVPFHDLVAGVATLGLLAGILVLAIMQIPIPGFLSGVFGLAMGWAFRGGVQAANELRHRKETNNGP